MQTYSCHTDHFISKWDKRYLDLAKHISTWSKDPSTQVGSVIIDRKGRPVSFGFNGFPKGMVDSQERLENREYKYRYIIHAEQNAILSAGRQLDDCVVYITHPPCSMCLGSMRQAGVTTIVCYDGGSAFRERWDTDEIVSLAYELDLYLKIYNEETGKQLTILSRQLASPTLFSGADLRAVDTPTGKQQ